MHDLIERLSEERIPMALATSAPKPNVVHTLAELELAGAFPVIVRGDEVGRGKPAPDVFIEAARRLGVAAGALPRVRGRADGHRGRPCGGDARGRADDQLPGVTLRAVCRHPPRLICADFDEFLDQSGRLTGFGRWRRPAAPFSAAFVNRSPRLVVSLEQSGT